EQPKRLRDPRQEEDGREHGRVEHVRVAPFVGLLDEAESLTTEAEQRFRDGEEANEWSDAYVLNAAMLATVLFLAGIAQPFRLFPVQIALLILATGFVSWGLYTVAVLPKA
ncbi:MAG: hypothetical protein P8177_10145, partial [Gemmatimonadota bacterium]